MKVLLGRSLLCLVTATLTASARGTGPDQRPNIVVILADDMGFSDIGCYGSEIRTPNLDGLARDGLRFTQFYNASKCEPSRASLLSGLWWEQARRGLQRGITLGQALHAAGYTTLATGKWHLNGNPVDRGFDHWFGFLTGATNYFKGNDSFRLDHDPFTVPATGFYTTDAFTDYAIRSVEEARAKAPEKPFFLYLAYNAPHDPLQAPAEDVARYQGKYAPGWDKLRAARYRKQIELGVIHKQWELSPRPDDIPAWDTLSPATRQLEDLRMAVYAAMVDRMDQNIGRFLAKLKEWKLEENTLVIFLSDNGGNPYDRSTDKQILPGGPDSSWAYGVGWANASDTPFRLYKRNQHEGGIATPFIVRWPKVIRHGGTITDQPAHLVDIMATCVDLSGCDYTAAFAAAPPPPAAKVRKQESPTPSMAPDAVSPTAAPPLAGISLAPLFAGKPWHGHDTLFFQLRDHKAVRAGNWKLDSHDGLPWELYRLDADRTEVHDLAAKSPDKVKQLEALYEKWWDQPDIFKATAPAKTPGYVDPLVGADDSTDEDGRQRKPDDD